MSQINNQNKDKMNDDSKENDIEIYNKRDNLES